MVWGCNRVIPLLEWSKCHNRGNLYLLNQLVLVFLISTTLLRIDNRFLITILFLVKHTCSLAVTAYNLLNDELWQ